MNPVSSFTQVRGYLHMVHSCSSLVQLWIMEAPVAGVTEPSAIGVSHDFSYLSGFMRGPASGQSIYISYIYSGLVTVSRLLVCQLAPYLDL